MKKQIGLIFLLFGFIYASYGQSKTMIRKNQYELQSNSDSTSNLFIDKGRSLIFTMIIDELDTFNLKPRFTKYNFLLKNIPKGEHKIVFINNEKGFKDSLNYTYHFNANGDGGTVKMKLPKRKYNTVTKLGIGLAYAIEATFVVLLATIKGAE